MAGALCVFPSMFCWGRGAPCPAFHFGEELGEGAAEGKGGKGMWMNSGLLGVWLQFLSGRMELILFAPDRVKVMV